MKKKEKKSKIPAIWYIFFLHVISINRLLEFHGAELLLEWFWFLSKLFFKQSFFVVVVEIPESNNRPQLYWIIVIDGIEFSKKIKFQWMNEQIEKKSVISTRFLEKNNHVFHQDETNWWREKINLKYSKAEQIFQKTFSVFTYSNNINWKSYSKWSLFFFQLQINPFVIYISHSYFSNEKQFCQCKKKISIIIRWIEENESNQYCNDRFVIIRRL